MLLSLFLCLQHRKMLWLVPLHTGWEVPSTVKCKENCEFIPSVCGSPIIKVPDLRFCDHEDTLEVCRETCFCPRQDEKTVPVLQRVTPPAAPLSQSHLGTMPWTGALQPPLCNPEPSQRLGHFRQHPSSPGECLCCSPSRAVLSSLFMWQREQGDEAHLHELSEPHPTQMRQDQGEKEQKLVTLL